MTNDPVLEAVRREYANLQLEDVVDEEAAPLYENHCEYARQFHEWGSTLLLDYVERDPTSLRLAQAKVLLLDRYFEGRTVLPKSHLNRLGTRGHVCLHQVLEHLYLKIRQMQLSIMPVQVFNPPTPPAPPPPPPVLGITLGEVLGDE